MTLAAHMPSGPHSLLKIIGAAAALGTPHAASAGGPDALRASGVVERLQGLGIATEWLETLRPLALPADDADAAGHLAAGAGFAYRLADHLAALEPAAFPLVLGGDHMVAIGTWRGLARRAGGAPGLIWIDTRGAGHAAEARATATHAMALTALLGAGDPALGAIPGPHLDPLRTCVIGAQTWNAEERALLERLGVRVFDPPQIRERGLAAVFCDALSIARSGSGREGGFGISLIVDAPPPAQPEPHGAEPGGIDPQALADALLTLRSCGDFIGLEILGHRPDLDAAGSGARWVAEFAGAALGPGSYWLREKERHYGAANYAPLPAVFHRGEGVWLWDVEGRRYLDMMSAYSAVSFGHAHPRLLRALGDQARRLALTSRAFSSDRLPILFERLSATFGYERALPVNTGLEAVETALKAARKWGYEVKGIAPERAEIIACNDNFHGRSIAIVGLSSNAHYRDGFGPFPPGLKRIPYGDAEALEAAITPDTAAFLVEPIQGEGGIVVPPPGYLRRCAEICARHDVLLIADEVQTGLARTGRLLACDHEGVRPDGVILGKALGGGLLPVSAFLADRKVMDVFRPGDHGSTFGGNPLGAAVATEVLAMLAETRIWERVERLGEAFRARLSTARLPGVTEVRGRGLLVGVVFDPAISAARVAEHLLARGIATRDTNGNVIRLAPPLIVDEAELDLALDTLAGVLAQSARTADAMH